MSLFSIRLRCQMPCESLDSLSKNWDPLKGTRRLPCVDPFGPRSDNFIGIKASVFKTNLSCFSPVDIGNPSLLKSSCVSLIIKHLFPSLEWIHHHHDDDEADLEEVKLKKRLFRHLTIFHHYLSFEFNWNLRFRRCYFRY